MHNKEERKLAKVPSKSAALHMPQAPSPMREKCGHIFGRVKIKVYQFCRTGIAPEEYNYTSHGVLTFNGLEFGIP